MFPDALIQQAEAVLNRCRANGIRLVTAESCTGGLIAACLTAVAGSSDVVEAGFVTYANDAKENMLGLAPSLIRRHGAVSEEVVLEMARGALQNSSAGIVVAVSGIAGPGGGSQEKPVGLVHIAAMREDGQHLHRTPVFAGDRQQVRLQAVSEAFTMLITLLESE